MEGDGRAALILAFAREGGLAAGRSGEALAMAAPDSELGAGLGAVARGIAFCSVSTQQFMASGDLHPKWSSLAPHCCRPRGLSMSTKRQHADTGGRNTKACPWFTPAPLTSPLLLLLLMLSSAMRMRTGPVETTSWIQPRGTVRNLSAVGLPEAYVSSVAESRSSTERHRLVNRPLLTHGRPSSSCTEARYR